MIKNGVSALFVLAMAGCQRPASVPVDSYQGVVELEETVLSFESAGRLQRVLVDEGDRVQAGAAIAELDDELVRATRASRLLDAEAALAQAKLVGASARAEDVAALAARVRAARATEDLAAKNLARERTLLAQNAVPQAGVDQLQGQLEHARAERESAEAQLAALKRGARREERDTASVRAEAAEANVTLEDERLARALLRAPIDGRVLDRHVEPGEVVGAGAPVVTLADPRRPYADVFVPQGELAGIRVGARAELQVDAERTRFAGKVEHISRRTEFTPRYLFSERERPNLVVRVRVRIDDSGERLHAGVPAFVTIRREGAPGAKP
jgi:HlyD family secretion protein